MTYQIKPALLGTAVVAAVIVWMHSSPGNALLGTVIVAVRTPDAIVIGIDSRMGDRRKDGSVRHVSDQACKAFDVNGILFAATGTVAFNGGNAYATALELMKQGGDVDLLADRLTMRMSGPLRLHVWTYEDQRTNIGLHFMFATYSGGRANLAVRVLGATKETITTHHRARWPGDPRTVLMLGHAEPIERQTQGVYLFKDSSTEEAIRVTRSLVDIAARDRTSSPFVGGPTDVATVGSDGIRWPHRKPQCK